MVVRSRARNDKTYVTGHRGDEDAPQFAVKADDIAFADRIAVL